MIELRHCPGQLRSCRPTAHGIWVRLHRDLTRGTGAFSSSRSKMSPFGHQIRALAPARAHIPSFGAMVLKGPTHPVPSFKPFFTLVGNANAEVQERTKAAASSAWHISGLERRSRDGAAPRTLQSVSKTFSSLAKTLSEHRRGPIVRYGLNATASRAPRPSPRDAKSSLQGEQAHDHLQAVAEPVVEADNWLPTSRSFVARGGGPILSVCSIFAAKLEGVMTGPPPGRGNRCQQLCLRPARYESAAEPTMRLLVPSVELYLANPSRNRWAAQIAPCVSAL
jgi:hypothetical protein